MDSLESSLKECIQARARITAVMDEVAQIARDGRVGADGELPESYEQYKERNRWVGINTVKPNISFKIFIYLLKSSKISNLPISM